MKKMQYPKEKMLLIRECIVAICNRDEAASKLLSVFLYWYDRSNDEAQDGDFTIKRTQADLASDACGLIDVKTIHDRAVPFLILLGYLDVQEQMGGNRYTLHIDRINAGIAAYLKGEKPLQAFLKSAAQLENSLIEITPDELEKSLINKKLLQLQLEKVLIQIRNNSNCKRGRKPRQEAPLEQKTESPRDYRDYRDNTNREVVGGAIASPPPQPTTTENNNVINFSSKGKEDSTKKRTRAKSFKLEEENMLTPEEQAVFDTWASCPWFKHAKPRVTATAKKHCATLATYNPPLTMEDMKSVRHWVEKHKTYILDFQLGNLVTEYPNWKSSQYRSNEPAPAPTTAQHILPTAAAETRPLNLTPEEAQARMQKEFTEKFIREYSTKGVFWTTTGDLNTIKQADKQPLEVLETWQYMPVEEAINTYNLNPRKYGHITGQMITRLQSRITVLRQKQIVSA